MKIRLLGVDLLHANEQTMDGQTERERETHTETKVTRLNVACRNSAKSPRKLAFLFVNYKRGHISALVDFLRTDMSLYYHA